MVAMEIMQFYIVQLIFEDTSILHYMGSNLIPTKKKKVPVCKKFKLARCYWV